MSRTLLVVNAGSSSVKLALYELAENGELRLRFRGQASGLGDTARLRVRNAAGETLLQEVLPQGADQESALARLLEWLGPHLGAMQLVAAGHRIVHGGAEFSEPVQLSDEVIERLTKLSALALLHQPHNLGAVKALARLRPQLPQVGCFDTAFHRDQPWVAQRFALPREYTDKGVIRYGFHGLSYEYIASRLAELDPQSAAGRVIVCHLGNGASACAMQGGRSVASTMGFSALDGLVMGSRCGSLDPGVVLYLLRQEGLSPAEVETMLYQRSGLLGMSELSGDMRRLLESDTAQAEEAIAVYCYRIVREIGSLAAALGGVDALVFTAGIGENSAPIRERVCAGLGWLGLELDPAANGRGEGCLSPAGSRARVWVIPTDEELMIARHTRRLLNFSTSCA